MRRYRCIHRTQSCSVKQPLNTLWGFQYWSELPVHLSEPVYVPYIKPSSWQPAKKKHHIIPVLASHCWLPLQCAIDLNILLIIFKAYLGAPSYFSQLSSVCENLGGRGSSLVPRATFQLRVLSALMLTLNSWKGVKFWKPEISVPGQEIGWHFRETRLFAFLTRVRWKDWYHFDVCPLNMKLKPGDVSLLAQRRSSGKN